MKTLPKPTKVWIITLAVIALGILIAGLVSGAEEEQVPLPAYLQEAKYITSAKCKLCHKPVYTAWAETQHAKNVETGPWATPAAEGTTPPAEGQDTASAGACCEATPAAEGTTPSDQGQAPPPELVYRYVTGFNPADGTWAEKGTACEACHGPGSAHMAAKADERKAMIVNPGNLPTMGQKVSLCGSCHGQYSIGDQRYAPGFLPGMDLFKIEGFQLDPPDPAKQFDQLNQLKQSKHFENGVDCLTCHDGHSDQPQAHQLRKPVIELCTGCHQDKQMATHAPQAAEGDTCATCHMPGGQHLFAVPAPPQ